MVAAALSVEDAATRMRTACPSWVRELASAFQRRGAHRLWLVGGSVRDLLLGRNAPDFDFATDATPEQVQAAFPKVLATGIAHGTVSVRWERRWVEVTTLRAEAGYQDGRHPDAVVYLNDIEADLARRDFTVNAIAFAPLTSQLHDPFDGLGDLARRRLRAVGDAETRFREDGLRPLRALRFVAQLGFELETETADAVGRCAEMLDCVSRERVAQELRKLLGGPQAARSLAIGETLGLMARLRAPLPTPLMLPERAMPESLAFAPRLATAFLNGAGEEAASLLKPLATWLRELRLSKAESSETLALADGYLRWPAQHATAAEQRAFVASLGRELWYKLREIAAYLPQRDKGAAAEAIQSALSEATALTTGELAVNGKVLAQHHARPPGPWVGVCLRELLAHVLAHPDANQTETLLEESTRWLPAG